MASDGAVVIKRIKKGGHGGHHGGAWKVAYADFVTAMMAFFLLMWLINTTTPEQKRGIADYFAPQSIAETVSGAGGVLGGKVMGEDGSRAGGAIRLPEEQPRRRPPIRHDRIRTARRMAAPQTHPAKAATVPGRSANASSQDGDFANSRGSDPSGDPGQSRYRRPVAPGHDRQHTGGPAHPARRPGWPGPCSSRAPPSRCRTPAPARRRSAEIIDRLPNRISITGHTEAAPFEGPDGMTNWELSSARANAARAVLAAGGLVPTASIEVSGKAGSEPLLPEDPYASANRRISIVLMREAPPVPPGHRL